MAADTKAAATRAHTAAAGAGPSAVTTTPATGETPVIVGGFERGTQKRGSQCRRRAFSWNAAPLTTPRPKRGSMLSRVAFVLMGYSGDAGCRSTTEHGRTTKSVGGQGGRDATLNRADVRDLAEEQGGDVATQTMGHHGAVDKSGHARRPGGQVPQALRDGLLAQRRCHRECSENCDS